MKRALALALALTATDAAALSCLRSDVATSFTRANEAEETYVVVLGAFDFDSSLLPPGVRDTDELDAPIDPVPATFAGLLLQADGFTRPVEVPVTVSPQCAANWCGTLTPDIETLAFVKMTESELILEVGPCGGNAFPEPASEDIARVEACITGECESADQLR